ncbi:MAG: bifunctional DNA primase/polymerase [Candidatus Peribacteraceae bacterium]|nr:bifunctional DNA primase/polymerase [Candidatus Peribacteraceae bacterium]
MSYKKTAKKYFALKLNPVPVKKGTKEPARREHQTEIKGEAISNYAWEEIGVSTGYASQNLEALDFDLKNSDDPKKFLQDYKDLVGEKLLSKLVVQKTPSGGYHFIYRCDTIESSQKLAKNKEGHAILETRGLGGYIKCYPSEGYTMVKRDFTQIPFITSQERFSLFIAGRKLNELIKEDTARRVPKEQRDYQSKFPEYDDDPEIGLDILEKHGWTRHSLVGDWVNLTRPDKDISDGLSAGYNTEGKFLFVFSTSQDTFITERPYDNHSIYAELECDGNYPKAYAKLFKEGHGDEEGEEEETEIDFLSSTTEENEYLDQARKGEIEHGLTMGWGVLDEYLRIKRNSVNLGIGVDNVGKSVFMSSLMASSSILHGWKWGIVAPENKTPLTRQRSIEVMSGKPITYFKDRDNMYNEYLKYSREKFNIVANKHHYSIVDVLKKGIKMYEYNGIDALLIDPYNFFAVEGDGYSNDNNILSKLRVFSERYCSVYVMAHPYSNFTRDSKNKDKEGFLKAPTKYDAQGGSNFAYRVDDVFTMHRIINHPSDEIRKIMQFITGKIKEYHTGGRPHDIGDYSELVWETRDGFTGYWDTDGNNPMYKNLLARRGVEKLTQTGLTQIIK